MIRRDPERLRKLRLAIRYLLREDAFERGHQSRLAEHFSVSRQRVHQVVNEEQVRREHAGLPIGLADRSPGNGNGAVAARQQDLPMNGPRLDGEPASA